MDILAERDPSKDHLGKKFIEGRRFVKKEN